MPYLSYNAAVEQCPKGICLELLVLPAAERRGNQEFTAQLPHSPRSEAKGGIMDTHLKPKLYKALTSSRIEPSEVFLKSIYERVHMSLSNPESGERNRFFLVIA